MHGSSGGDIRFIITVGLSDGDHHPSAPELCWLHHQPAQPIGQFGTRLRVARTQPSQIHYPALLLQGTFNEYDDPLLNTPDRRTTRRSSPSGICPSHGPGHQRRRRYRDWLDDQDPQLQPEEIVENRGRLLKGKEIKDMKPWIQELSGQDWRPFDNQRLWSTVRSSLTDTKFEIHRAPDQDMDIFLQEQLEGLLPGTEKTP